jgi:DNA polymerase-3 subunit delta'
MASVDWGLIGNRWAGDLLRRQLARGTAHHAYLICGPSGVGRTRLALAFAQALLCERPPEPGAWCGECRACRQVPARAYPDLHWIERPEDKQGITIDQVRELQRQLSLTPLGGTGRVAILVEIEKASDGAANALLKTLEEPVGRVRLLLTASDAEEVAPTIASRCEILALRPVPEAEIVAAIEGRGQEAGAAHQAAAMARGRPELALRLMDEPALRSRRLGYAGELEEALQLGLAGRFALADRWKDDEYLEERLTEWLNLLGDALRPADRASHPEGEIPRRPSPGPRWREPARARKAFDATLRTLEGLSRNANSRLALETLMLDLPAADPHTPSAR